MSATAPVDGAYRVAEGLLAGSYPGDERAERLEQAGVRLFVDLTELGELAPYAHVLRVARHEQRPIVDFGVTNPDRYREILDLVDAARSGGDVYVHCFGGRGRTGTVVGCWLARHGLDDGDPLGRIAALRAGLPDAAARSPETAEQRRLVEEWPRGA
jgi:hypothetical protein